MSVDVTELIGQAEDKLSEAEEIISQIFKAQNEDSDEGNDEVLDAAQNAIRDAMNWVANIVP